MQIKKKGEENNNLETQNEKELKSKVQDEKDLMDEIDKEIKDMLQSDVSMGDAELCSLNEETTNTENEN